MTANAGLME